MAKIYYLRREKRRTKKGVAFCCICEAEIVRGKAIFEERPTGDHFTSEKWAYCSRCWDQMERLRHSTSVLDTVVPALDVDGDTIHF